MSDHNGQMNNKQKSLSSRLKMCPFIVVRCVSIVVTIVKNNNVAVCSKFAVDVSPECLRHLAYEGGAHHSWVTSCMTAILILQYASVAFWYKNGLPNKIQVAIDILGPCNYPAAKITDLYCIFLCYSCYSNIDVSITIIMVVFFNKLITFSCE